jgi:succinyl-diaminopimelate desuccinylase
MKLDVAKELERLVSFNTVNDPREAQRPTPDCAKYINSRFEEYGFSTDLIESDGYFTAFGMRGTGPLKILFLAHYDVVPPGEDWKTDPFALQLEGDRAYGRGTCDNKGNVVSLIKLAEAYDLQPLSCTLMLAASGDEEIGGNNGALVLRDYLMKKGLFPNHVVITDGINQVIIHRRRNVLPVRIKTKRKMKVINGEEETLRFETSIFGSESRHTAYQRPGVDRHAFLAASKYLDLNGYAVVKSVRGGFVKSNVIPAWVELDVIHPSKNGQEQEYDEALTNLVRMLLPLTASSFPTKHSDLGTTISPNLLELEGDLWSLYCDIRAMTNDADVVESAIRRSLQGKLDIASLKVYSGAGYVDSDPHSGLIRAAEQALEKLRIQYKLIEGYGASDSRFFAGHGADVFDFGPRGDNLHGPNEWVSLKSIDENARFYYTIVEELAQEHNST